MSNESGPSGHFIKQIIDDDVAAGKHDGAVITRFPPEPNGYLHIGHAKSICLNFGMALDFNGRCNLRFDDTNPSKEDVEYVEAIKEDVRWLGFDWGEHVYNASDYFQRLYEFAEELIENGKAFVCDLSFEEINEYRGAPTQPGKDSPYRDRSVEENRDLFRRMRAGEFEDGSKVLRAKIDMTSPNVHLRDPVIYRIRRQHHHRTGDEWCIYPMYDFAHGLSDSIEGVTHSICTLEFEVHRPLYDWFLENLDVPCLSRQYEFARLNLTYTVMSKRKLHHLVDSKLLDGWDDPRMPTICGLRRRGYTPESIRAFCEKIGVTKFNGMTDVSLLEHCIREDLNKRANRYMAVLRPLRVVITNYPDDAEEYFDFTNNPEDKEAGTRQVPFSKVIYVEQDDFMEDPPRKFFRLGPGREVRLRYAWYITCTDVIKDDDGNVVELHCTYDPESRGGKTPDNRKVKGTLHWVSAKHAEEVEVRLYDRLFTQENPEEDKEVDFMTHLNPNSLETVRAKVEPHVAKTQSGERFQFERLGYFCRDIRSDEPVFNRTVTLRDSWAKLAKKGGK